MCIKFATCIKSEEKVNAEILANTAPVALSGCCYPGYTLTPSKELVQTNNTGQQMDFTSCCPADINYYYY